MGVKTNKFGTGGKNSNLGTEGLEKNKGVLQKWLHGGGGKSSKTTVFGVNSGKIMGVKLGNKTVWGNFGTGGKKQFWFREPPPVLFNGIALN